MTDALLSHTASHPSTPSVSFDVVETTDHALD
jgi:hypothetical protein